VLKEQKYVDSPIGRLTDVNSFDVSGMNISRENLEKLFTVNKEDVIRS
jgi:GTP-dependent phosphoenolpyruvate carboxykinase